jgi:hypothetical protein
MNMEHLEEATALAELPADNLECLEIELPEHVHVLANLPDQS